ncbi:ABC-type transport auxiliary lipoprotein family protein [Caballeronia sp. LZ019]|nr:MULTISPECIES: ABC-type transport auxiliary lipoprotein family protein [unclassified Caballeronia]MDR5736866.1 ABC-type transport auxiliary lipoprotein family protein [Caballeronia sp. LZ016]MDR5810602.1 ABC-type transport auxiliary lipoprotein family protein [Caballeronia sp. LZ019]
MTMLGGCASNGSVAPDARYDLGAPPASGETKAMPPVKVLAVGAPRSLETDAFVYRMSYTDAQRTGAYANSHWTMPPAQLLTQRLRAALSARGPVLTGADPVRAPLLELELTGFEQVFDAPERSHGSVSVRATLTQQGRVVAQRVFAASAPAPSADAAGGARALAAASDDLIAQLSAWLDAQPLAASR